MPFPYIKARRVLRSSAYARAGKGMETEDGSHWWLDVPGPPELSVERVWHYTDSHGLLGILRDQRIWATSARMLNDSTEIQHGVDLFEKALSSLISDDTHDEHQRNFMASVHEAARARLDDHELFVVCASMNGDDLSQWRGYSGGHGFAVGLNPHIPLVACGKDMPTLPALMGWPRVEWRPVVYDPDQKTALMAHVVQYIAASTPADGLDPDGMVIEQTVATVLESIARVKHHGFKPEQEVRLVIGDSRLQSHLQFRAGGLGPTPYVEIGTSQTELSSDQSGVLLLSTEAQAALPILQVVIGPAQDQGVAAGGVRSLLRTLSREQIVVSRSDVPYR